MIGKRRVKETVEIESTQQLPLKCGCKPQEPLAFIVFEYCPKYDLFTYVAEGFTVGNELLCHALFYQIIQSVRFLHQTHSLAHLDLKLENIVLDSRYLLKLIDFAYCEPKSSLMSVSKGTERYFAPEVAKIYYKRHDWHPQSLSQQMSYLAEKADVYSLGILLFTMMFGQPPFNQNDP